MFLFFFLAALGFWGKSLAGGESLCSTDLAEERTGVSGNTAVEWRQRLLDVMLMLDAGKDGQGRLLVERIPVGVENAKCKELRVLVPSSP